MFDSTHCIAGLCFAAIINWLKYVIYAFNMKTQIFDKKAKEI